MRKEELTERVQVNPGDGQTWREVYELSGEAKGYIARRAISCRRAAGRPASATKWQLRVPLAR